MTPPPRHPDPLAAAAFDQLAEQLARGEGVSVDRMMLTLALAGKSTADLTRAVDVKMAARQPRRIAASAAPKR